MSIPSRLAPLHETEEVAPCGGLHKRRTKLLHGQRGTAPGDAALPRPGLTTQTGRRRGFFNMRASQMKSNRWPGRQIPIFAIVASNSS